MTPNLSEPPREIELKLALDRDSVSSVMRHASVVGSKSGRGRTSRLVSAYYDTPRGALAEAGVALRIRRDGKRYVQTAKGRPDDDGTAPMSVRPEYEWPLRRAAIDAAPLATTPWAPLFRRAVAEGLVRRFTTDFVRREVPLALAGGTRALLCVDTGEIRAPGTRRRVPISEIEIELVEGAQRPIYELARSLCDTVPAAILMTSKAARGMALAGGARDSIAPVRARGATLDRGMSAIGAFAAIAHECVNQVAANAQGLLADTDPEWVHQMRVGTRRLRACLKLVARIDETARVDSIAAELKWLAGALGAARDLDVFATEVLPPIDHALRDDGAASAPLAQLARRIAERRRVARDHVRGAVASKRFTQLVLAASALVAGFGETTSRERVVPAASGLLAHRHRSLHRSAKAFASGSADERHAARILVKKLRYAAEFFAPLYPRKRVRPWLRALTELQQVLGIGNDARTASRLAAESGPDTAAVAVRAYLAAQAPAQESALRKAWKRFERAEPFWKRI